MKVEWNKKYTTISVYSIIVVTIATIIILCLININLLVNAIEVVFYILTPFILGFAVAYLFYRPANYIERKLFAFIEKRNPHPRVRRNLSILLLYILVFALIILIMTFVVPQFASSLTMFFQNLPNYIESLKNNLFSWMKSINLYTTEFVEYFNNFQSSFLNFPNIMTGTVERLPSVLSSVGSGVLNFSIGLIVSVYILATKEKFARYGKKLTYMLLKEKFADKFIDILRYSNDVFLGFILSTLVSSAFVGLTTFVFMTIIGMPYAVLISVIIFCTNIIPFFGPFIGAIPSILILLMVDPIYAFIFIIFILILQQIDGNIILPRIISYNIGLSAFWVLFALIFFGGIFGFWGMVVGVPIFAVIYSLVTALINNSLEKKGVPIEKFIYPADKIVPKKNKKVKK